MTDNFSKIKKLLKFDDEDKYYYVQILARKKENANSKSVKTVKDFYISNMDYFDSHTDHIKKLCDFFNARAYIRMARRSWKATTFEMNVKMAQILRDQQFQFSRRLFSQAAGSKRAIAEDVKIWHIDMDLEDFESPDLFWDGVYVVKDVIRSLQDDIRQRDYKLIADIPTPNGLHILTEPFNVKAFTEDKHVQKMGLTNDDIQKNNPTILYAPF